MDVIALEDEIKEILTITVLDLEGEINTPGNYLYLSGLTPENLVENEFEFTLVLADKNFQKSEDSLKATLAKVLSDVSKAKMESTLDITLKGAKIKKKDELYMYEVKLVLVHSLDFTQELQ